MDRLCWYHPGEAMEEILCQAGHVGIYDGDLKQSAFEQGTVSLTLQRVIWADSSDPDCRLILHHSLVEKVEKHHKSMFSRGGKVVVTLKRVPSNHPQGPVAASAFHYIRFVFRNGGEDDFYKRYMEALSKEMWKRNSSSSSSGGSRSSNVHTNRLVGISGIERRLAEQHHKTHETIQLAFDDMGKLMDQARDMVNLSKKITETIKSKGGEIDEDETIQFKQYLLSLGVSDPVSKSTFGSGSTYFEKLAQEIAQILLRPLKEMGGTMTLPEAYCRVNRARGVELISPEDLVEACHKLDKVDSPMSLVTFESGVKVLQLRSARIEESIDETCKLTESLGYIDANRLAKYIGISTVLALQRLIEAEKHAKLCRDDSIEGFLLHQSLFNIVVYLICL